MNRIVVYKPIIAIPTRIYIETGVKERTKESAAKTGSL